MSAREDWPDAYTVATITIAEAFNVAAMVTHAREDEPNAYPTYGPTPASVHDVARRALAGLLNMGWMPPKGWPQ